MELMMYSLTSTLTLLAWIVFLLLKNTSSQPNGDLRLVNGDTFSEGRVEIIYEGTWYSLSRLGDKSETSGNVPTVVCRQLHLPFTEAEGVPDAQVFGDVSEKVLHADITCKPDDGRLMDCKMIKYLNPEKNQNYRDVGVRCKGEYIESGEIRLVNGSDERRGRLVIYLMALWTPFCSIGFSDKDAAVACRQLGLHTFEPVTLPDDYFGSGVSDRSFVTNCTGSESRLGDCPDLYLSSFSNNVDCAESSVVNICCPNETDTCLDYSPTTPTRNESTISRFLAVFFSLAFLIGMCVCFCCCHRYWMRKKRRERQAPESSNQVPGGSVEAPSNQISLVPVIPGASGMPPPAPGGAPYATQPYSYPAGQAPPPTGAYPAQPTYNPTAATTQFYPLSPGVALEPSSMSGPYGAPGTQPMGYPHPQAAGMPPGESYPTKEYPLQPATTQPVLQVQMPIAPATDERHYHPPETPPPPYEEYPSSRLGP